MSSTSDFPFLPIMAGVGATAAAGTAIAGFVGESLYQIGRNKQVWGLNDEVDMILPQAASNSNIAESMPLIKPTISRKRILSTQITGAGPITVLPNLKGEVKHMIANYTSINVWGTGRDADAAESYTYWKAPLNTVLLGTDYDKRTSRKIHMLGLNINFSIRTRMRPILALEDPTHKPPKALQYEPAEARLILFLDKSPNNTFFTALSSSAAKIPSLPADGNNGDLKKLLQHEQQWDVSIYNPLYGDRFIPLYDKIIKLRPKQDQMYSDTYWTPTWSNDLITKSLFIPLNIESTYENIADETAITTNKIMALLIGSNGTTYVADQPQGSTLWEQPLKAELYSHLTFVDV